MKTDLHRWPAAPVIWLLLLLAAGPALARESCGFVRDPALRATLAVPPAGAGEWLVGTLNAFRLFDAEQDGREREVLTPAQFAARIERIARYIRVDMGAPALVALQEVEDETALVALTAVLRRDTGRQWRWLLGARDGDIATALLYEGTFELAGHEDLFSPNRGGTHHDRFPLAVALRDPAGRSLTVLVLHLKSMLGLDDADPRERARVRDKRRGQAQDVARWLAPRLARGERLLVLGDLNAPRGEPVSRAPRPDDALRAEPYRLLREAGLVDRATDFLAPGQRWTYFYRRGCTLDQLDHVLASPPLATEIRDYAIVRGDTCVRAREACSSRASVSDHEAVVVRMRAAP